MAILFRPKTLFRLWNSKTIFALKSFVIDDNPPFKLNKEALFLFTTFL